MPTYRNDTTITKRVTNIRGRKVSVPPGGSVQTYFDLHRDGFTQTSAAPYYNPIYKTHNISFSAQDDAQTILLNRDFTREVNITNLSASLALDVYLETISNTPALYVAVTTTCSVFTKGLVGAIVLNPSQSGTCLVQEVKF